MTTTAQFSEVLEQLAAQYPEVFERLIAERLVREPERRSISGVSRAHWARLEAVGRAPQRIVISERIVAWKLTELTAWVDAKIRGEEWEPVEASGAVK